MKLLTLILAALLPCVQSTAPLAGPIVDLGYSKYQGITQDGINKFLGLRFAAPPTGDLRWRAPAAPFYTSGIQNASQPGDACLELEAGTSTESEDCLFMNVYTPSKVTEHSKLPVWVFFQPGGYGGDLWPNQDGTEIIQNSGNSIIFVNFNYRVGIFGFLASSEIQANGSLNVGLLDQLAALEWIRNHITRFGGDPDHVVLHGQSAGAGSIALLLTAHGGRNDNLYVGAMLESPALLNQLTVPQLQFQYDALTNNTGCSSSPDTLACLRSLDISILEPANKHLPLPGRSAVANYPYVPCIDGHLLQTRAYEAFQAGLFIHIPILIGAVTDEGTTLGAPNASTAAEVQTFFQDNYPDLSDTDAAAIIQEYPKDIEHPFNLHNSWFPAAELAYGEEIVTCPGLSIGKYIHLTGVPTWNYRFNVLTSAYEAAGVGVLHALDLYAIFGGSETNSNVTEVFSPSNLTNVMTLQKYYTSFVRALNPNIYSDGALFWPRFTGGSGSSRLLINNNDTETEAVPAAQWSRCEFWEGLIKDMDL